MRGNQLDHFYQVIQLMNLGSMTAAIPEELVVYTMYRNKGIVLHPYHLVLKIPVGENSISNRQKVQQISLFLLRISLASSRCTFSEFAGLQ